MQEVDCGLHLLRVRYDVLHPLTAIQGRKGKHVVAQTPRHQGRIEPLKVARGHATHIDGIVLNVTKFRI